jgi:hypothetical protein
VKYRLLCFLSDRVFSNYELVIGSYGSFERANISFFLISLEQIKTKKEEEEEDKSNVD